MRYYTKRSPETAYSFLIQSSLHNTVSEFCGETQRAYTHRNLVALARVWQALLDSGQVPSRADLARHLSMSRAHVTQVLRLLGLPPEKQQGVLALGDPIEGKKDGILREWLQAPPDDHNPAANSTVKKGEGARGLRPDDG